MFIKKTACNKYLMSLTVHELSALRVMGAWYKTVSAAVAEKHCQGNQMPSTGDPTKVANTLNTIWENSNQFGTDIAEARNAGST